MPVSRELAAVASFRMMVFGKRGLRRLRSVWMRMGHSSFFSLTNASLSS